MLNVKYGYRRSLLSVLCVHFVCISARFHKAYGYGPNGAVPPETMGGSVAVTTGYVALVRHEEEITMEELFEERFSELVRNFKHMVFIFYARGTLSISPPQSPCLFLSLLLS